MTILLRPAVTADIAGQATVRVNAGDATLDALGIPYATATLDVPLAVVPELDDLDPRADTRIIVRAEDAVAGTFRTFNLGLRSRTIDHNARSVTVELASDEALLFDYVTLTQLTTRQHQASLRAVVTAVLAKIGATLAAGTPDANVTAYWPITNTLANPSVEGSLAPWTAAGGSRLFNADIAMPATGVKSAGWESLGAGLLAFAPHVLNQGPSVAPGRTYVFSGYALAYLATPARTIRACIRWLNDSGTAVGVDVEGVNVAINPSTWVRCSIIGTAPVGASRAELFWRVAGGTATGQFGYVDAAMFYEGDELVPYFAGDTPASSTYTYAWATAANASASTRTPATLREPELFVWKPGTSAWDYLQPFTTSAGLRLYCDEARVWRLVDPATHAVAGVVSLAGWNSARGADTISREDADVFATGVVVRYAWTDPDGIAHTAYDAAGTPSRVFVLDMGRPYPGPGAAAKILARRDGAGRTQEVAALVNWATTPGMEASITMPAAPLQRGKVTAVRFSLGDDALMDVSTRGLIDIPGDSWAFGPDTVTWENVVGTWATFKW